MRAQVKQGRAELAAAEKRMREYVTESAIAFAVSFYGLRYRDIDFVGNVLAVNFLVVSAVLPLLPPTLVEKCIILSTLHILKKRIRHSTLCLANALRVFPGLRDAY